MLKNVVLPAPFGPIRLAMARSGMSKSTDLTATSPPKTLVMPRASRMFVTASSRPFSLGIGPLPDRIAAKLLGALAVGDDAFKPQPHHQDQKYAENEKVV